MRLTADAVIVGAGFAGAATAYQLTRLGVRNLVLVEAESMPGVHSSGRNAGIVRTAAVSPAVRPLAEEGLRLIRQPPPELQLPPGAFRPVGLLILASGLDADAWRGSAEWIGRDEVERLVPVTAGGAFEGAVFGRRDGVVDIAALLHGYLRAATAAGARLLAGAPVTAICTQGGRVTAVETAADRIDTPAVVNAAGAWASRVAALAGAALLPLRPCRRHLYVSAPLAWADRDWPVVWDVTHGLYFRPEPPGLLLCACDEVAQAPGEVPTDPGVAEVLAGKVRQHMPGLGDVQLARSWAGLRTLISDGCFVLGRDPQLPGFVWCAGLGGHGVTTSAAVGRIAAEAVLGAPAPPEHALQRFAPGA